MAHDYRLEAKLAAAMGVGGNPAAMDVVKRSDFNSDGEYIQALVDWDIAHDDPKRADLTRKYTRILQEQREKEAAERIEARQKEIRENTKLTAAEAAQVEATATEAAIKALKDGKISYEDFPQARTEAIEKLEKRTLDSKASNAFLNEQLREMYRETRDFDDKTAKEMSKQTIGSLTGGNTGNNAY